MNSFKNNKLPPPPTYQNIPYAEMLLKCCCDIEEPKEKRDCYFYHEEPDMGAHIDVCSYYGKLGYCPCENCEKYIQKSEAFNIMKKYVDNRTTED